jgi:hypothetical protein
MSDTHPIAVVDDTAVPIPANARALFAKMAAFNDSKRAAEVGELQTVRELCLAYNTVDEDAFGEAAEQLTYHGAQGTPPVAEYLSLEISALLGMAPGSGACLIGRVLNCVYRHPLLWDAVQARTVRWNRAVDVIEDVTSAGLSLEAAHKVDQRITPLLMTMPRARTRRILAGLIALADPAQARSREEASRDQRGVSFFAAAGSTTHLTGRLDLSDAIALDDTLGRLATTLATLGDTDSLDIRRASAMGILADPARALTMLTDGTDTGASRITEVILHLAPEALTDGSLVGRAEGHGPLARETWIDLVGHDRFVIRPLVDLNAIAPIDAYEIPDRIRNAVTMRSPVDMFPYGNQPARRCDLDHTEPYDHSSSRPPGQTRIDNLAPLTRKPHRAKTAGHWRVTQYEGGWLEWVSPAGYRYATGPYGTLREVTAA